MILDYLLSNNKIKKIINSNKENLINTTDGFNITLLALDFLSNDKSLFVVLPNLFMAQKYYDELINILDETKVLFYPADELITAEMLMASGDFKFERINTITSLLDDSKKIVITNYNGAIRYQFNKQRWQEAKIVINKNDTINMDILTTKLIELGYKNVYTTTKTGEFSKRGSIFDIFPLNYDNPIRLDFFGDDIDEIRTFDSETQKSIDKIENVVILPVVEMLYCDKERDEALSNLDKFISENKLSSAENERYELDRLSLLNRNNIDLLMRYISLFNIKKETIFDFKENKKIYMIDTTKINDTHQRMIRDLDEYCSNVGGYSLLKLDYFLDYEALNRMANIKTEGLININNLGIHVNAMDIPPLKANPKNILMEFSAIYKKKLVICLINNENRLKHLRETLVENGIYSTYITEPKNLQIGQVNIVKNEYLPSFKLVDDNIFIYNEKTIFEIKYEIRKIKYKSIYKNTVKISKYDELEIGDYVVHYDHGIGKYLGLKTLETSGLKRDYIHIGYANNSAIYIPLEQVNLIQKYANPDDRVIKLNELGSPAWAKAKMRVRKKIHDISEQLIKLYSQRSIVEGFQFEPDSTLQLEFESDFMYETTPDQEKAIRDVKKDMESPHPMDRLVCGDVGYGKTEVALRASFKAVLSGKQVLVLAPTTILSRQHYLTFKDRMEKYGVHVELLNRFVTAKKQTEILEKLKTGEVDILVATHKGLSNNIKYKDLGLLVIDEEQRFGVTHKEKIKELKVNVDAITLSATPIPRTLQMSIVGIKDLSMIETPPKNRYPIQTYVLPRNDSIIRDAIVRELSRGGQVFYMYNKVEDIENVAAHVMSLVPEARVCIGHGKMNKDDLEDMLIKFIDHEYDVLVCTTIIETGLDIPDTNTIIIHDADLLGLSQLYQIRGRVGRSDRIAYAYLMYSPNKELKEKAYKRLEALKEFSDLGSGYKIAMRDLAIRGAGDLLGSEQSGFIESVGLEMYMRILEEEIKDRKGEMQKREENDISLSKVYTSRHIDDSYIDNDDVKIAIHKRIDKIERLSDLKELEIELNDRFGLYNKDLEYYMYEKLFNSLCKLLNIKKIENDSKKLVMYMSDYSNKNINAMNLFGIHDKTSNMISLKCVSNDLIITFDKSKYKDQSYLKDISIFLDNVLV
ncbi:MAG: transcription-repair coupling factor [Anaeroplasmataceae bacterium]